MNPYVTLGLVSLTPAVMTVIITVLDRKTILGRMNKALKQVLIGILFGGLAVIGTEFGVPINGAQINCRDAAVLTAGLMFGGPAGIIAGFIGGLERWIAVYWGVGKFTQIACSVSTFAAGIYAAILRKHLFEKKNPGILLSFAIGIVVEVFHLTMVFVTHVSEPVDAYNVVMACSVPMITANAVSLVLSAIAKALTSGEKLFGKMHRKSLSYKIQSNLLIVIAIAFVLTSAFVYAVQSKNAMTQADTQLEMGIEELASDIEDASDENLLVKTRSALMLTESGFNVDTVAARLGLAEINLVDETGIIFRSTNPQFVGFDMNSGEQSREFFCLLGDTEEYVQQYGPISYNASMSRKYAGIKTDYGFLQVGYDAENFQHDIDGVVIGLTKNRHIGKTGYLLIVDEDYSVLSSPVGKERNELERDIKNQVDVFKEGKTTSVTIGGEKCFCRYRMSEGYYLVSALPEEEALQLRNMVLVVNAFMEILVFAILFAMVYRLIERTVVKKIDNVNESLTKITGGDLDEVVNVRSSSEFESLSDDINQTVGTLKNYIAEASARIDKELEFARSIQSSALPSVFPAFPKRRDIDIHATMATAKEVGGDFYDFYMTGSDDLHFLIADVSGKGIPAAMFMMRAKTELKSLTESDMDVSDVFTRGNDALCEGNDAGMFVTAWQGGIDLKTGKVLFANAGHNPPIIKRVGKSAEYLHSKVGFVLAGMEDVKYKMQELQLDPGDLIFLYTDGVTEAQNKEGELFGETRLLKTFESFSDDIKMSEVCKAVKKDVDEFVGEAPQFDDITMLALRYTPVPEIHFDNVSMEDAPAITAFMEEEMKNEGADSETINKFKIVIDELVSNVVKYGYGNGKTGPLTVRIEFRSDPRLAYLKFIDKGMPYNPLSKEDPDVTLPEDTRDLGGLGIFIVKGIVDDMKYKYEDGENIVTLMLRL